MKPTIEETVEKVEEVKTNISYAKTVTELSPAMKNLIRHCEALCDEE
ncbi:hypothetical protein KPL47_09810 [Clostridium estertheticum]|nr:hypothetical protein [Clostridium estertheticum]MBU3176667.1 hypothetical protein [Clostridium estertheticum]